MANALRDDNRVTTLLAVSSLNGTTPITLYADPSTHALLVDATVTATIDPTGLASDSNQTDGSQKTQIVDAGGEAVTVTGGKLDVNASVDTTGLATSALQADIITAIGAIPGGGGIQYTEGDVDTSITGTAAMMEVATNTLQPFQGSVADGLLVNLGTNNDVTVTSGTITAVTSITNAVAVTNAGITTIAGAVAGSEMQVDVLTLPAVTGTVTANAGTNLNTSALALEAGGNLAAIKAKTDNIPALGQALAAASVPVVLTASQLSTLTPPAAITGFATETTLGLINAKLVSGTDIGDVTINNASGASAVNIQDGGNTITVDGAVTVTNATAANLKVAATLDAETTKVIGTVNQGTSPWVVSGAVTNTVLSVVGGGTEATAQRVTIASDSTGVLSVDDNGGTLTVDGTVAVTNAGLTALNGAISGTEVQVDVLTMPTVTVNAHAVTNAGTFVVQENGAALTSLQLIDNAVSGSGFNITQMNGVNVTMGNGASGTGVQRVTLANDSTGIVALTTSTASIGKLAANSGVDIGDVDVTSISAGTNLIGDVDVAPRTTGGWSVGNYTSGDTYTALTNGAQVIKASAGKFGGYYIYNPNTAATYVFIYNIAAASVTVGTSTAKLVFCIPASSGANLELLAGIPFDTAMSIAAATTGGGNTAPSTALEAMVFYK